MKQKTIRILLIALTLLCLLAALFRDVYLPPIWVEDWLIWQYSDRGELEGYDGEERYIDLNVMRLDM
ncbi:MAG: hypothetical protein IJ048_07450 [Clostridia bacterium]|nr:hypothetical protein [Clostridia bacterium]